MAETKIVTVVGEEVSIWQTSSSELAVRVADAVGAMDIVFDRANATALRDALTRAIEGGE